MSSAGAQNGWTPSPLPVDCLPYGPLENLETLNPAVRAVGALCGLCALAFVLTGCPPPIDTGEDGGATGPFTVTSKGGQFVRDGVYFDIPEGAVEADTTISVRVVDDSIPEVPNRKRVSFGYRITPSALQFKQPVIIAMTWIQDRVPGGVQPNTFDMRRSSGNDAYLELPGASVVDQPLLGLQGITARTDRLGLFWLTSPAQPAISEIKLTPEDANLAVGGEQQFTAEILDPGGNPITDAPITWSVVAPRVAAVDATGKVTALDPGVATLTVTAANVSATAKINVRGDTKGPLTFVHENPFPTGNDLWGGALSNGYAFFAGGNGTVLSKSPTDEWARLYSAPVATFKAIAGNFPTSAVAVGTSINTGVLVEVSAGSTTPLLKTFASSQPRAVWFDGTHGMAVGDGNDVLIRRNGAWVTEYSPSFESLMSVVGDGAGGFVTVGNLGSLYKFNPATSVWDSLFQTRLSVQLEAGVITDATGSEAWAVGGNKLWHFVSNAWTALNLPVTPALNDLHAIALFDSRVFVSGSDSSGTGHILVYEPVGATWTSQAVNLGQTIRGIFGTGTAGYAVGDLGALWEYQSATNNFVERSRGFIGHVADIASTGTDRVAAMNVCANKACTSIQPTVLSRTSTGDWVRLGTTQPFNSQLTALAMRGPTEVYAATRSGLYIYDGSWSTISVTGGTPSFNDIALCGTSLWTVGSGGASFRGTATGAIRTVANTPSGAASAIELTGISCPSATDQWMVGVNLQSGAGVMIQNRVARNTQGVNHAPYLNVWSPGVGEAFAFGDARFGGYWDTQSVQTIDQLGGIATDVVTSQWGSSADNHYLVGFSSFPIKFSFALRSDGVQFFPVDPGAEQTPTVVTGSSNTDVWIGTEYGGILRGVNPP